MWSTRDLLASALLSAIIAVVTTVFFERKLSQLVESKISARYMDMQLSSSQQQKPLPTMGSLVGKTGLSIPPPIGTVPSVQNVNQPVRPSQPPPPGSGQRWTPF